MGEGGGIKEKCEGKIQNQKTWHLQIGKCRKLDKSVVKNIISTSIIKGEGKKGIMA